jgi:hypothetical protein
MRHLTHSWRPLSLNTALPITRPPPADHLTMQRPDPARTSGGSVADDLGSADPYRFRGVSRWCPFNPQSQPWGHRHSYKRRTERKRYAATPRHLIGGGALFRLLTVSFLN